MSVKEWAEKRLEACAEAGIDEDTRYWRAYLDGVNAAQREAQRHD